VERRVVGESFCEHSFLAQSVMLSIYGQWIGEELWSPIRAKPIVRHGRHGLLCP
jgi:hypothetical protein